MPRNKKLELENIGPRKWKTTDGRFGVLKMLKPINPMEVTEIQSRKIQYVYSIRDLREFDVPGDFLELAPELEKLEKYSEAFPWLGQYTGEGSFDTDDVQRTTAKVPGGAGKRIHEVRKIRDSLLVG